ncbi:hypothetical protein F4703DRAFT_1730666 [Phycomyces blakesleeanus]
MTTYTSPLIPPSGGPGPLSPSPSLQDDGLTPHLLSLKVLRLSRPLLATHSPVYYEGSPQSTPLVEGLESLLISDIAASHPIVAQNEIQIRDFGLSQILQLPSSFGNIYLGESFGTFVSVNNESEYAVHQVGVKIELQTSSQRFVLSDTTATPRTTLDPQTTYDATVTHEIKELGVHILVCSTHYTTPDGKKRHFRRVFLEAQLQNVSAGPMYLERMRFEPSEHFDFNDLNGFYNSKGQLKEGASVFGDNFIHPQDVRQYLYLLTPRDKDNDRIARTTNALGKLDIVWRSAMGDTGRLQTSQLTRKPPLLEDIEIQPFWLTEGQVRVCLETPFQLGVRIRNYSGQNMKLVLSAIKTKMGSVLLSGLSSRQLGDLAPSCTTETQLEFFPLTPGLQRVTGLKVTDLITGKAVTIVIKEKTMSTTFNVNKPHIVPQTNPITRERNGVGLQLNQTAPPQAVAGNVIRNPRNEKEMAVNDKLKTFDLVQAVRSGKLPTNNQMTSFFQSMIDNPSIETRKHLMSEDGQSLLKDMRKLLVTLQKTLAHKNSDELFQSLVYHIKSIKRPKNLPTRLERWLIPASKIKLSTIYLTRLLILMDQVRNQSQDIKSKIKNQNQQMKSQVQQGAQQQTKDAKAYVHNKFPPEKQTELINRLKTVMHQVQREPDYQKAIDFILYLFSTWGKNVVEAGKSAGNVASNATGNMESNGNWSHAALEIKAIFEDWAQGQSLDPLLESIQKVFYDIKNDSKLHGYYEDVNPGYVDSEQSTKDGEKLLRTGQKVTKGRYQHLFYDMLDESKEISRAMAEDPVALEINKRLRNIHKDLWLDSEGNPAFKPQLLTDMRKTLLPAILEQIKYVPIPRIEYSDPQFDVVVENVVLSGDTMLPNIFDIKMENFSRFSPKTNVSNVDRQSIFIDMKEIQAVVEDVVFYYKKKTGFPKISDRGVASLIVSLLILLSLYYAYVCIVLNFFS